MNLSINFIADFCPHLGSSCCFSHYVSAKFHLWPSSGDSPEVKFGRNVVRKTTRTTKMRTKVRNKINTQIKKPHLKKGFPIKTINEPLPKMSSSLGYSQFTNSAVDLHMG